jgi:hypothetical protein
MGKTLIIQYHRTDRPAVQDSLHSPVRFILNVGLERQRNGANCTSLHLSHSQRRRYKCSQEGSLSARDSACTPSSDPPRQLISSYTSSSRET